MTDKELFKLALDALNACNRSDMKQVNEAITALKERLAQPEQEPRDCILTEIEYAYHHGWPLESQQRLVRMVEAQRKIPPAQPSVQTAAATLQETCHGAAKQAGWWADIKTGQSITANPYCFSNKLMLVVSELAEAMEGDRKGLQDDKLPHRTMREVELADAVIRIFDLAGAYDMDLGGAISEKMAFNAQRADHKIENRNADGGKAY